MVGLLGYALAGMAEGAGDSIVDQAKAKREAALEELRAQREMAFRRGEREAAQAFTSSENEKTRAFSAEQSRLAREASGDLVTGADGTAYSRVGSTATPLKDADGKPIKTLGTKKDMPADVATMEYLIEKGVASDYKDAWDKVKSRDALPPPSPAEIEKMVESAVSNEFEGVIGRPKPEDIEAARQRNRERILKNLGMSNEPAKPGNVTARPEGVSDEQILKQAKDAIAAGADKAAVAVRLKQMGIDPKAAGL